MAEKCFAYINPQDTLGKTECRVLNVRKCKGKSCAFFCTETIHKDRQKKSAQRILSLPVEQQRHITDKYYTQKSLCEIVGGDG